jgi:hypothetical protein
MDVSQTQEAKQLRDENTRLRRLVAGSLANSSNYGRARGFSELYQTVPKPSF